MELLILLSTIYRTHIISDILSEIESVGGIVNRLFAWRVNNDLLLTLAVSNVDMRVVTLLRRLRNVYNVRAIPTLYPVLHDLTVFMTKCAVDAISEMMKRYREGVIVPFLYHLAYNHGKMIYENYFSRLNLDPDQKFKELLEMLKFLGWFRNYIIRKFTLSLSCLS